MMGSVAYLEHCEVISWDKLSQGQGGSAHLCASYCLASEKAGPRDYF